jgi:hypothetical protein
MIPRVTHSELLPIPPIDSATDPVHSAADLRERWRALMGPLGFGERLLWLGFLGEDLRLLKTMTQMPMGKAPSRRFVDELMPALRHVVEGMLWDIRVALLLTGPGQGGASPADRRWASLLTGAATRCNVPLLPIFRANDESIFHIDSV